jgi:hypothetical protein
MGMPKEKDENFWTEEKLQEAFRLLREGKTVREVAEHFGLPYSRKLYIPPEYKDDYLRAVRAGRKKRHLERKAKQAEVISEGIVPSETLPVQKAEKPAKEPIIKVAERSGPTSEVVKKKVEKEKKKEEKGIPLNYILIGVGALVGLLALGLFLRGKRTRSSEEEKELRERTREFLEGPRRPSLDELREKYKR